jgi:single-strand DNA-binding protein
MANKRSLNRVILIGTTGRDPEITHIPSLDKDVAKFSIATTEVWMDKSTNQFQEQTEWHNIVAWGAVAKKVERSVSKGTLVLVEGKLKTRKWKDQNDQERRTTEIYADTVVGLERSANAANKDGSQSSYGRNTGNQQGGYGSQQGSGGGNSGGSGGGYNYPPASSPSSGYQAPPEMQYDDINDIPYDESDPF